MKPAKISILAPGLIGGSVALACARTFPDASLFVWSRKKESLGPIQKALPKSKTGTDLSAASGSDVVVLGAPASALADLVRSLLPHLSAHTLVTDVASVKGPVGKGAVPASARPDPVDRLPSDGRLGGVRLFRRPGRSF